MKTLRLLSVSLTLALLAGCMNYYQVTDTVNGTKYYTKSVKDQNSGAVMFKSASNGSHVLLEKYRIKEISRQEYKEGAR